MAIAPSSLNFSAKAVVLSASVHCFESCNNVTTWGLNTKAANATLARSTSKVCSNIVVKLLKAISL